MIVKLKCVFVPGPSSDSEMVKPGRSSSLPVKQMFRQTPQDLEQPGRSGLHMLTLPQMISHPPVDKGLHNNRQQTQCASRSWANEGQASRNMRMRTQNVSSHVQRPDVLAAFQKGNPGQRQPRLKRKDSSVMYCITSSSGTNVSGSSVMPHQRQPPCCVGGYPVLSS